MKVSYNPTANVAVFHGTLQHQLHVGLLGIHMNVLLPGSVKVQFLHKTPERHNNSSKFVPNNGKLITFVANFF
jgi:hypothetical protein